MTSHTLLKQTTAMHSISGKERTLQFLTPTFKWVVIILWSAHYLKLSAWTLREEKNAQIFVWANTVCNLLEFSLNFQMKIPRIVSEIRKTRWMVYPNGPICSSIKCFVVVVVVPKYEGEIRLCTEDFKIIALCGSAHINFDGLTLSISTFPWQMTSS